MRALFGRPHRMPTVLLLATAVLLTGCAGVDKATSDPQRSDASGATEKSTTTAPSASASATSAPPAAGSSINVTFAGGQVSGDSGRVPVEASAQVTITVSSDVADEIHLHGYDLSADVGPEAPGTLTFQASIPGVFEAELENRGTVLFTIQVG